MPLIRNLSAYKKIYENNVVHCNTAEEFYRKVKFYLENEEQRKEVVQKARSFMKCYNWENVARREWGFINLILLNQ